VGHCLIAFAESSQGIYIWWVDGGGDAFAGSDGMYVAIGSYAVAMM